MRIAHEVVAMRQISLRAGAKSPTKCSKVPKGIAKFLNEILTIASVCCFLSEIFFSSRHNSTNFAEKTHKDSAEIVLIEPISDRSVLSVGPQHN